MFSYISSVCPKSLGVGWGWVGRAHGLFASAATWADAVLPLAELKGWLKRLWLEQSSASVDSSVPRYAPRGLVLRTS